LALPRAINDLMSESIEELVGAVGETVKSIEEMIFSVRAVAKKVEDLALGAEQTSTSMNTQMSDVCAGRLLRGA